MGSDRQQRSARDGQLLRAVSVSEHVGEKNYLLCVVLRKSGLPVEDSHDMELLPAVRAEDYLADLCEKKDKTVITSGEKNEMAMNAGRKKDKTAMDTGGKKDGTAMSSDGKKDKAGMDIGTAVAIFLQIESDQYSVREKAIAIRRVLDMPTHNGIKKDDLLRALSWLWKRHFDIDG